MHRGSPPDISWRNHRTVTRATINSIDDDRLMQEADADMYHSDSRKRIERVQNYGFTSAILPRDGSGGKTNEGPAGPKGKAADAVIIHHSGTGGHPVMIAADDRRHRPRGLAPGESAQYDDQGQMSLLGRAGAYLMSTKAMASLRHVTKSKQPPPQKQVTPAGKAVPAQQQQAYDHTGGTPNTEVRCTGASVFVLLKDKVLIEVVDDKVFLGGRSTDGMALVVTVDGPSENVYAKVGG